jgi:hypothetical protein
LKKIKGKDIINKVKEMKKNGITFEEVMFYVFLEMMEKKSSQLIMDMKNDDNESVKMIVAIVDDDFEKEDKPENSNVMQSMVS